MFRFYAPSRPGMPVQIEPKRPDNRAMDSSTGDAGRDGYTRLSRADRETGVRQPVGSDPVYAGPRIFEDT